MQAPPVLFPLAAISFLASAASAQCAWQPHELLSPATGSGAGSQYFARSLALDGTALLVGSPGLDGGAGEAKVFNMLAGAWIPETLLIGIEDSPADDFGRAVALCGDVAAVGAPLADEGSGSVTIFERGPLGWAEVAFLAGPSGDSALFGAALALQGNVLLVGAPKNDAVHVFERLPQGWLQTAVLGATGPEAEELGASLAFDGVRAVAGAPESGEVLVFELSAGEWFESARLELPGGASESEFGTSVALSGDLLAVGAEGDDEGTGSVFLFRHAEVWTLDAELVSPSEAAGSLFGASVALDGDVLVVGAPGDEEGLGSVSVYLGAGGSWFPAQALKPYLYLPEVEGQFGSAVALADGLLVANIGLDETGAIGAVGDYAGAVQTWSEGDPGCEPLIAAQPSLSVALGGCQKLLLGAGSEEPAHPYFLLGSASGISPGLIVGAVVIPLNPDPYLTWTVTNPNSALLQDTFGILDPSLSTVCAVCLPAGAGASLVGLELHHAYVGLDFALPGVVTYSSNPVALALLP